MTRHDDNLARLAKARAKLAETTPGEWVADRGRLTAPESDAWLKRFPSAPARCDIFESEAPVTFAATEDAEHIAAWHNAAGLVLDWCESALERHWPSPDYLHAEKVLEAVAGDE